MGCGPVDGRTLSIKSRSTISCVTPPAYGDMLELVGLGGSDLDHSCSSQDLMAAHRAYRQSVWLDARARHDDCSVCRGAAAEWRPRAKFGLRPDGGRIKL